MPPKKSAPSAENTSHESPRSTIITPVVRPAPAASVAPAHQELLVEMNERLELMQKEVHKLSRRFFWFQVSGWLKLVIIVAPVIVGTIYLMPFLQQAFSIYGTLINDIAPVGELQKGLQGAAGGSESVNAMIQQYLKGVQK